MSYSESPQSNDPNNRDPEPPTLQTASPVGISVHLPRTKPWVTYTILGFTIVVYLLQVASEQILGLDFMAALGAKSNPLIQAGQLWRLITPMFLHGSILHIGFNMYALMVIGPGLERYYGHGRFTFLYFISGFAGNAASFIFSIAPSLGASTAIFGLVAAEAIFIYRNRFLFGQQSRSMLMNIGVIIIINLIFGYQNPGIDNWGHIGGLLGGVFFAWFAGPILTIGGEAPDYKLVDRQPTNHIRMVGLSEFVAIVIVVGLNIVLR